MPLQENGDVADLPVGARIEGKLEFSLKNKKYSDINGKNDDLKIPTYALD